MAWLHFIQLQNDTQLGGNFLYIQGVECRGVIHRDLDRLEEWKEEPAEFVKV